MTYSDCATHLNPMLMVMTSGTPSYKAIGEFVCSGNAALFSNNTLASNMTTCNATAQWTRKNEVKCYTGN